MADQDEEADIEIVDLPYPFVDEDDQKLRCFIAEHYLNAEIDANILIDNMSHIYAWLKNGELPAKAKGKPNLRAVKAE